MLKAGGRMLHTTCFMTAYHGGGGLGDDWRFSPEGLALLCSDADEVMDRGIGHPLPNLLNSWIGHVPVPIARWHPLTKVAELDSRGHAALVWVHATKRLSAASSAGSGQPLEPRESGS